MALPKHTLDRFPDVRSLAVSSPDEVLRLWEGLGYYRRGTNLHRAAQIVLEDFGGDLPTTSEALMTLPGIGRYTAAAIASISFGEPLVAVDANVRRVGARLFALRSPTHAEIERHLDAHIDPKRPGDFNEALMDLGATICSAEAPRCDRCPLSANCGAFATGDPGSFPIRQPRPTRPTRARYALVWICRRRILLRRRSPSDLLPGLWGFVQTTVTPAGATPLAPIRHGYTHFGLILTPAVMTEAPATEGTMVPFVDLDRLALSRVDRKVLASLDAVGMIRRP